MSVRMSVRAEIQTGPWAGFIGQSEPVLEMKRLLERLAPTREPVLLQGETGVGKGVLAKRVHEMSRRASGPFVSVDCGSLPRELVETELFGRERGAFTGAVSSSQGLFGAAHGGTLFLDQIQDMPLELQTRLLRVLQEREVRRVGATAYQPVDVRVIVAADVNLGDMVERRRFRADLWYRLNRFPVRVPALRERDGDISRLAHHFLETSEEEVVEGEEAVASREGEAVKAPHIPRDVIALLNQHTWPGNVRELENVIVYAKFFPDERGALTVEAVRGRFNGVAFDGHRKKEVEYGSRTMEQIQRDVIEQTLRECKGNKTHTAKKLRVTVRTIRNHLARYRAQDQARAAQS